MSEHSNAAEEVFAFPGSRWWSFDFHAHTPASHDTPWNSLIDSDEELTPEQWLLHFMQAGIDCVAVTDHNSGAWIDTLKSAYNRMKANPPTGFRELHLFPGVEISVHGGFHLLAIFDPSAVTRNVTDLLARVEYSGTEGLCDGVTRLSASDVVKHVSQAGAIAIPAHADQDNGLLEVNSGTRSLRLDANTVRQVVESELLMAVEWANSGSPIPQIVERDVKSLTRVLGSDCHNFRDDSAPGTNFTWVKMASPSLEGLRLALMDGEGFSVRRSLDADDFEPNRVPQYYIDSIEIESARYMGRAGSQHIAFSPWFNALIGGRGTGKSTVVHAMRLASQRAEELRRLGEGSDAWRTFQSFSRTPDRRDDEGGLQDDTRIALVFIRDGVRHRLQWIGHEVTVEDDVDGEWRPARSQGVFPQRFPVRLFSQGQIAELAGENRQALLDLVDEAAEVQSEKSALNDATQAYLSSCARARELESRLGRRGPLQLRLEDVRRKLKKFEEAHNAEVLKSYQRRTRQERELSRQFESTESWIARIRGLADELTPEDVPAHLFDQDDEHDSEALSILGRLHDGVRAAVRALSETADDLASVIDGERQQLSRSRWQEAVKQVRSDYDALVNELKEQGVEDPSEYGQLVQDRQQLDNEWEELEGLEKERDRVLETASQQLEEIGRTRMLLSERREEFLARSLSGNEYVTIGLEPFGRDPRAIERSLRDLLEIDRDRFEKDILSTREDGAWAGICAELVEDLPDEAAQARREVERRIDALKERLCKACHGVGDFGGHFNNFLSKQYQNRPEYLDHIMVWYPEDGLDVRYSQAGDGRDFRPIAQASAGQRAAAMLAFLLVHGPEPIVLDQPEDDLDNHLIYDLVVHQLRANKEHRQIIAVTHNPNIVVNGDAEMVHAFDFRNGQCLIKERGGLQARTVRDEVCHVMEGGRDAFERRYRRLRKGW